MDGFKIKKRKSLSVLFSVLSLCLICFGCDKQVTSTEPLPLTSKPNPHKIAPEVALSELKSFLGETKTKNTSTISSLTTDNIEVVLSNKIATKTAGGAILPDTLLYVVNFDQEGGGTAILAADDRISSMIIAVTENGQLHPDELFYSNNAQTTDNIDDFFCEEDDDFYVWQGPGAGGGHGDVGIIGDMIIDYVGGEIDNGGSGNYNSTHYQWVTTTSKPAMLSTLWGQGYPYNMQCPKFNPSNYNEGPAGCVTIAAAQILNYHKRPNNFTLQGSPVLFNEYKDSYYVNSSAYDKNLISTFIYNVAQLCIKENNFKKEYARSSLKRSKQAFNAFNYSNVKRHVGYDSSDILNMLNSNKPVMISATKAMLFATGHAWVIDGYREQEYINIENGYVQRRRLLLHCNWGWSGLANGYYASKIFDTRYGAIEFDDDAEQSYYSYWLQNYSLDAETYSWNYRFLTYNIPTH